MIWIQGEILEWTGRWEKKGGEINANKEILCGVLGAGCGGIVFGNKRIGNGKYSK